MAGLRMHAVVLTGGAHRFAGGTLSARNNAVRCTCSCPRDLRGIIWELQWRTISVHQRLCACVGEGCAACSENQWQRAPTLSVASVVECPRLATGLAMSIEASPELPGAFSKNAASQNAASAVWNGSRVEISKSSLPPPPPAAVLFCPGCSKRARILHNAHKFRGAGGLSCAALVFWHRVPLWVWQCAVVEVRPGQNKHYSLIKDLLRSGKNDASSTSSHNLERMGGSVTARSGGRRHRACDRVAR